MQKKNVFDRLSQPKTSSSKQRSDENIVSPGVKDPHKINSTVSGISASRTKSSEMTQHNQSNRNSVSNKEQKNISQNIFKKNTSNTSPLSPDKPASKISSQAILLQKQDNIMHNEKGKVSETINLSKKPKKTIILKSGQCLTIGDIHGNIMMLLSMFTRAGIIKNISDKQYNKLYKIYMTPTNSMTKTFWQYYRSILDNFTFNTEAYVRILGDDLADRGNADPFQLYLYQVMHRKGMQYEFTDSNHSKELLVNLEEFRRFKGQKKQFESWMIDKKNPQLIASMLNINTWIKNSVITLEEIQNMVDKYYTPYLKTISYNMDGNKLSFFSHAPYGVKDIIELGEYFGLSSDDCGWDEKNPENGDYQKLFVYIDKINAKFQDIIKGNQLKLLFHERISPAFRLNWNRDYDPGHHFLAKINNFVVTWYHGHDHGERSQQHVKSLDSDFGKEKGKFRETKDVRQNFLIQNNPHFVKEYTQDISALESQSENPRIEKNLNEIYFASMFAPKKDNKQDDMNNDIMKKSCQN